MSQCDVCYREVTTGVACEDCSPDWTEMEKAGEERGRAEERAAIVAYVRAKWPRAAEAGLALEIERGEHVKKGGE